MSKVAEIASDVVRYALGLAQTDAGHAAVLAAGGPVADLLVSWGLRGLSAVMADWTAPTVSDEAVRVHLETKGLRVVPFDPAALFGRPA